MRTFESQSLIDRLHVDVPILSGVIILCGLGLVILYSAGGQNIDLVIRQAIRIVIAIVLMLLVAQLPPSKIEQWSLLIFIIGMTMLFMVLLIGSIGKGAQRWLTLGIIHFQPSELMKLALPMAVSWHLSRQILPPNFAHILVVLGLVVLPVFLIAKQPDLGTATLVAISGLSVLFFAGITWRLMVAWATVCMISAPMLWYAMYDYQRHRVLTLLNPEQDPLGAGYHIIQSMIAVGSGGIYGKGWLNSTQSHLEFLPERSTDFIFAVYCEEFGLLGALLLIGIYLLIIIRGFAIAAQAQQTYSKLLAAALVAVFFAYVFVNMSMAVGQLPVVGVPLPLISYGGTSMVTSMLAFGILMSIHTHNKQFPG